MLVEMPLTRYAGSNFIEPALPLFPFGIVIALLPHLDRGEHAHDLFFADFERPAEGVMRSAVGPGGFKEVPVAQKQAGGLGSADALAAAISNGGSAAL